MRKGFQMTAIKHIQAGFTLVELAIVMVIIGLLVGGVIKGQELVNNAKITRVAKDLQGYEAALNAFRDQFKYYPGDFPQAISRLSGCTASSFCQNGDGNNIIGSTADSAAILPLDPSTYSESYSFWKHLLLANLISGVVLSSNPAAPVNGETTPTSPFGGKYEVFFDPVMVTGAGSGMQSAGQFFRLSSAPPGQVALPLLSPRQAATLDRKIDNGDPSSGRFLANYGSTNDNCKNVNVYNETNPGSLCVVFYRIF